MMPNLVQTIQGFERSLQFKLVTKTVNGMDVIETSTVKPPLFFNGTLEPLHSRELLIKPEGERKFKWWELWTELDLHVDDQIQDEFGTLYRVMSSQDWRQAGYRHYELIEGPGV
jgi:hypothetical protein